VYRNYFSRAYLYEGVLKNGKGTIKCLFVDNDRFYMQVLAKLFADKPRLVSSYRCWIPGLKKRIESSKLDADICLANVSLQYAPIFAESATFTMQTRVRQTLDIKSALETNKRYRDRRRAVNSKIRKFGLTHRISDSAEDFDLFYNRMALPLINKFGDAAIEANYEELKPFFDKGLILFVLHDGNPVSGVLFYENNGILTAYRAGLLDGKAEYVNIGAMSAWYFFLLEYARQQGYQKVDFMRSMPFLNDGVYMTKQHWGASSEPFEEASTIVYLFNRSSSDTLARVVENIPLITRTQNGLEGVVSIGDEHALTSNLEQKLTRQYGETGLVGLKILRPNGAVDHISFENRFNASVNS